MAQPQGPQGQQGQPGGAKPGAMTMAMQAVNIKPPGGPKVLRVGLIQEGKIVEERIIRSRETVTVGPSEKNHFLINAPGLPARFEMFQLVGGDYILNYTEAMTGRVALAGGVQKLEELRATGGARNAGTHFQVKLNDNARGKVVVGNVTVLFQFVTPPPITPKPQLPAAARGGFVKSIDWLFTAFVVFSFMFIFGFVIFLENADFLVSNELDTIPESMARLIFQEPMPPPEPVEETPTEEGEAEEVEEAAPSPAPSRTPSSSSGPSNQNAGDLNSSAEARARIAEEAAAQAEAMLLGALGSAGGALDNVLAGGAVTGNAADVLAQASGVGVAAGGAGGELRTRSGGGGSGQGEGLGGLRAGAGAGQAAGEGGAVTERRIAGRLSLEGGGDVGGTGDFDANLVVRQIRARMSAIKRCYENELRRNPTLAGKVTVQFRIQESGNVSNVRASENTSGSSALADCVMGTIARFRFSPGPEGGSVDFAYPFVFAPQN